MKTLTHLNLAICSSLTLALALVTCSLVPLQAQEPANRKIMMEGKMTESCQKMKQKKQEMMADMKAQDAKLTEAVAKMNNAPEDKKMSLMAAVITSIVEQQTAKHARMAKMQEEMMTHMMEHMQTGKESMAQCPMMKEMMERKGMKEKENKSGDDRKEHQNKK
jgi:hypothetical protein